MKSEQTNKSARKMGPVLVRFTTESETGMDHSLTISPSLRSAYLRQHRTPHSGRTDNYNDDQLQFRRNFCEDAAERTPRGRGRRRPSE